MFLERLLADDFLNFPKLGLLKLTIDVIKMINLKERVFWEIHLKRSNIWRLLRILKNALKFSCDSSCLFNVAEEAFPAVLRDIYVHPEQCYRLPSVVSAFASPMKYLLADAANEKNSGRDL